jgi:tRNA(Ile)-lysidine synthetase-like protein
MENKIIKVCEFWFPDITFQEFWFSDTYDAKIRMDFYDLWMELKTMKLSDIIKLVENSENKLSMILGIIIVLDQFSRNLQRTSDRSIYAQTDDLCIQFLNSIAKYISELSDTKNDINNANLINKYQINHRIFILLPFRHQRTTTLLDFVMKMIKSMESMELNTIEKNIVSRFKVATLRDYSKVTDTIVHVSHQGKELSHDKKLDYTAFSNILDDYCMKNYRFLEDDKILSEDDKILSDHITKIHACEIYNHTVKFITDHKITNVCISLSGGVDSMVLSLILMILKKENKINNLCAVHVDYGNREVSKLEADFVTDWSSYLSIPLITRRIEHMKRDGATVITDSVDRTLYESETKNIRFNLYKEAIRLYNVQSVMLGHHRDDLAENVMMNVLRGGEVLNLFTMKPHQIIDGVPISRPMLGLPKSEIFELAHLTETPYLKDTTPEDCFRGTVRKVVFPALQKIDPMVLMKLNKIGSSSDRWENVINTQIIKPMTESVQVFKNGFLMPFKAPYKTLDTEVWKKVLCDIFHNNEIKMISNKNLNTFIRWLNSRSGFIPLSNDYTVFCYKIDTIHQYLLICKSEILRQNEILDSIGNIKIPIKFSMDTENKILCFNGWTIKITNVKLSEVNSNIVVQTHFNPIDILRGSFSYYYHTCKHSQPSIADDSHIIGNITYSLGHKNSQCKAYFKNLGIERYIPMIHLGYKCFDCNFRSCAHIIFRIEYSYN